METKTVAAARNGGSGQAELRVPLTGNWDASLTYDLLEHDHAAAGDDEPVFVGRVDSLGALVNAIGHPKRRGTYLVSGYRGAGKTSLLIEAARRGRARLPENWRLLPLVLNVSEVSASLEPASAQEPRGLGIDARRLLTALLRALRNAVQQHSPDRGVPSELVQKVRRAYSKAEAAQYSETQRQGQERIVSELREAKRGFNVSDVLKPVAALAALAAAGVEGVTLVGSGVAVLHVVAATLAGSAIVSFAWSATRSESSKQEDLTSLELVRDNSLHQLESDLKDILTGLNDQRLRPIIVLEELDKVDDEKGEQLDSIIRYFKNLFTQAPALFFFLTDKQYYDLVASRIQNARRGRSYSIEHTFFTHRVFVRRPSTRDCLDYLQAVFADKEDRDVIGTIARADEARVRQFEEMSLLERFIRVLLFRSQDHLFDLKNEMRRYVQVDHEGRSVLVCDETSLPEHEQRLAVFQFLLEQKDRAYRFGGGRDYANEVLRGCLHAVFGSVGFTELQSIAQHYPTVGENGDQLTLDEEHNIKEAVDSLIEDLERGNAVQRYWREGAEEQGAAFVWQPDAAALFRVVARLEPHERELADALAGWARIISMFASTGQLRGVAGSSDIVDRLQARLETEQREVEALAVPLPREEAVVRRTMAEREVSPLISTAYDAHQARLVGNWGVELQPLSSDTPPSAFLAAMRDAPGSVILIYGAGAVESRTDVLTYLRKVRPEQMAVVHVRAGELAPQTVQTQTPRQDWDSVLRAAGVARRLVVDVALDEHLDSMEADAHWGESTATELRFCHYWLGNALPESDGGDLATRPDDWSLREAEGVVHEHLTLATVIDRWAASGDQALFAPSGPGPTRDELAWIEPTSDQAIVLVPQHAVPQSLVARSALHLPGYVPFEAQDAQSRLLLNLFEQRRLALVVSDDLLAGATLARGFRALLTTPGLESTPPGTSLSVTWHRDARAELIDTAGGIDQHAPGLAVELLRISADSGNTDAMLQLAVRLETEDEAESTTWEQRFLDRANPQEITGLANRLRITERRIRLYESAMERGDTEAMVALGDLLTIDSPERTKALYTEAARKGSAKAMRRLAALSADDHREESLMWTERLLGTRDIDEILGAADDFEVVDKKHAQTLRERAGEIRSASATTEAANAR